MITSISNKKNDRLLNVGTHNGAMFHCDEVVGMAILNIAYEGINIIRTRDTELLKQLDVVIDVGGGKFDHHVAGFSKRRPTGEMFASAGLVWQAFGEMAIEAVAKKLNLEINGFELTEVTMQYIKQEIDKELIIPVDLEDNGDESAKNHAFSFVSNFLPAWFESGKTDAAFLEAVTTVVSVLTSAIKSKVALLTAEMELIKRLDEVLDGILVIPSQTMPWLETVVEYNDVHRNKVKFVVFPYSTGGWAAQCVPPSLDRKFEQLTPFPKEWAGEDFKHLPRISGIADAEFCHNGRFFVRAGSKISVMKMCRRAMLQNIL